MVDKAPRIDARKAAADLGMTPESYVPVRRTVEEMAAELLRRGMVPPFSCPVMPLVLACGLAAAAVLALAVALLAHVLPPLLARAGLL